MCLFCKPNNPCPECLEEMVKSQPQLQIVSSTPATERLFVVEDETDPGYEVSSYEAACKELDILRSQGAGDPRIIFIPARALA